MPTVIEKIENNASVEYTGDVRAIGNIGKQARVVVKDGSLFVDGSIEDEAEIRLISTSSSHPVRSHFFFVTSNNILLGRFGKHIEIVGVVGESVKISFSDADDIDPDDPSGYFWSRGMVV